MTTQATYALFAQFYDAYVGEYAKDIPAYLALAASCSQPILEIGCGSGRVLLPLLRAGHTVTGVDISDEMLELAQCKLDQQRLGDKCTLLNHDYIHAPLPYKHTLALVTFYTFNYLLDAEQQSSFLRHVADSLTPGSKIALHLFCPGPLRRPDTAARWIDKGSYQIAGENMALRDRRAMLDGQTEERIQVFTFDTGRREEIRTIRRYVTQSEIANLLVAAGFTSPVATPDLCLEHLAPIDGSAETHGEFLVVAEKS
jgi:SAM-dependent methyltransferase